MCQNVHIVINRCKELLTMTIRQIRSCSSRSPSQAATTHLIFRTTPSAHLIVIGLKYACLSGRSNSRQQSWKRATFRLGKSTPCSLYNPSSSLMIGKTATSFQPEFVCRRQFLRLPNETVRAQMCQDMHKFVRICTFFLQICEQMCTNKQKTYCKQPRSSNSSWWLWRQSR